MSIIWINPGTITIQVPKPLYVGEGFNYLAPDWSSLQKYVPSFKQYMYMHEKITRSYFFLTFSQHGFVLGFPKQSRNNLSVTVLSSFHFYTRQYLSWANGLMYFSPGSSSFFVIAIVFLGTLSHKYLNNPSKKVTLRSESQLINTVQFRFHFYRISTKLFLVNVFGFVSRKPEIV